MLLDEPQASALRDAFRRNPVNAALIDQLPELDLPDCWLVAGCLFGTLWNIASGRPASENIRDYDIFYFDASDVSYEAEDVVIRRVDDAFAALRSPIEVRNQARVHLWYESRFGRPYTALGRSTDGIDRFLVACTCIGVRCSKGSPPDVYMTPMEPIDCEKLDGLDGAIVPRAAGLAPGPETLEGAPVNDLLAGILRANPRNHPSDRTAEKMTSYRERWPWLTIA